MHDNSSILSKQSSFFQVNSTDRNPDKSTNGRIFPSLRLLRSAVAQCCATYNHQFSFQSFVAPWLLSLPAHLRVTVLAAVPLKAIFSTNPVCYSSTVCFVCITQVFISSFPRNISVCLICHSLKSVCVCFYYVNIKMWSIVALTYQRVL